MSRDSMARAYASMTLLISADGLAAVGAGGGAALTCVGEGLGLIGVATAGGGV